MSDDRKEQKPLQEGYQPIKKGYLPTQDNLDTNNPPQGGSGVNSNNSSIQSSDRQTNKE